MMVAKLKRWNPIFDYHRHKTGDNMLIPGCNIHNGSTYRLPQKIRESWERTTRDIRGKTGNHFLQKIWSSMIYRNTVKCYAGLCITLYQLPQVTLNCCGQLQWSDRSRDITHYITNQSNIKMIFMLINSRADIYNSN